MDDNTGRAGDARRRGLADRVIVGWLCGGLVLLLMVLINVQVVLGALRVGQFADFDRDLPLLGRGLTTNSLIDLQWHLMVLVSFLPMGILLLANGHVRVDFLFNRLSPRGRAWIDVAGHLLLAAPFLALMLWQSWRFAMLAWNSGEGSSLGGLRDYWMIRSVVFVGFAVFAVALLADLARKLRRAAGGGA
jgi:TRAP-type mannitol/chloroaromatic compound transport system permease small subunit